MKSQYENISIIEDEEEKNEEIVCKDDYKYKDENQIQESNKNESKKSKENKKSLKKSSELLQKFYTDNTSIIEIGVDEAGRGPLFGRVYTAAVILPKDDSFDHFKMKDSKKFHSKKKIEEVANYIKENAIAWYVSFEDERKVDEINILQATQKCMHDSIINVRKQLISIMNKKKNDVESNEYKIQLLIDGNYFNPVKIISNSKIEFIPHLCIEGGDNKYSAIAAASILAKVSRDNYIEELVKENPELSEKYGIDSNKGYGAKKHIDGIQKYGITQWHRKTFVICKNYA